jgi:hypothetical protein
VREYLAIYMNDQLALGMLWREVARRSQRENRGTPLEDALARVATAIGEDVALLERMMDRLAIRRSRTKPTLASLAERAGRLKLNGRITGYSPLSRFEELDFLVMGIDAKKVLWANLRDLAGLRERLPDVDFDGLIERAGQQRAELDPFHARAGMEALGGLRSR